jgi:hypothetical protein
MGEENDGWGERVDSHCVRGGVGDGVRTWNVQRSALFLSRAESWAERLGARVGVGMLQCVCNKTGFV